MFSTIFSFLRTSRRTNARQRLTTAPLSLQSLEGRALPSSTIPTEMVQLHLQSTQWTGPKSEWIDMNGDGDIQAGEVFVPVGNRLDLVGEKIAEGAGPEGSIRWIDVNHDGKRQGNETFLFLPDGDLQRVAVSGPSADRWLINDLRRFGNQGNGSTPSGPNSWYDFMPPDPIAKNDCPVGGCDLCRHGGVKNVDVKCNGNTTTATTKHNDGTIVESKVTTGKDGSIVQRTTTVWNPDGSVTRTQTTTNKDGSTTTTTTTWNPDGSGSTTKETKDKDGNTTKKVTAEYDAKGDKTKQTQEEGGKTKEWKKDPKSKAWSNNEDQSAKKPPNEQKGGLSDKLPPKPAKPK